MEMSMRADLMDIYIERTQHMAIVCLTRREGLQVEFVSDNEAIDLKVYLPTKTGDDQQSSTLDNLPYPVCEFVFDMTTDNGYWRWLRLPSHC